MPDRRRGPAEETAACTRTQEAVWFGEQVSDLAAGNNLPMTIELLGQLDEAALAAAVAAVAAAQPALRTSFSVRDGRLRRRVEETAAPMLAHVELAEDELAARVERESRVPLDLLERPWRVELLRTPRRRVLFAVFHHAIFDGPSKDLFAAQCAEAYAALAAGVEPNLPLGRDDAVAAERDGIERLAPEAVALWDELLPRVRDALTFAPLPGAASRARPEAHRFELELPERLALDRAAERCGVSLFTLLTGAVQLLQHAYAGRADGDVATLVPFGVRDAESAGTIGMFANELPLCSSPRRDQQLPAYLAQLREAIGRLSRVRRFPYYEAVARCARGSDPSRLTPRFAISWWEGEREQYDGGGVRFVPDRALPTYGLRWDARLRFVATTRRLRCAVEYSTAVVPTSAAARIAEQLRTLLHAICEQPERPLAALPLLPPSEQVRLTTDWNRTARPLPNATIAQAFAAQVARTPEAVALRVGDETLSYRALDAQAEALAARLAEAGVRRGTRVALYLERGVQLPLALIAVSKTGAAFVPLDPSHPAERVAYMIDDAGVTLALTEQALAAALPRELPSICVDDGRQPQAPSRPARAAEPHDVACIMYTSGSTGRPKGALLPQRSLVNLMQAIAEQPGIGPGDVYLSFATITFDIGVAELIAPLLTGASIRIATSEQARDSEALAALLNDSDATITFGTPSRFNLLVAAGWRGGQRVMVGGETLTSEQLRVLIELAPEVWHVYGPTETFVYSTMTCLHDSRDIPIGRPLANTLVYVVDRWGALVPTGATGELWLGGAGVAQGYNGRPELTRERFVSDPFRGAGRLYRTGDLARHRDDGQLEFLGRIDDQVKIRGFRVEPGEVQAALEQLPAVRAAAVVAREDTPGQKRLVAYVVPASTAPTTTELRAGLARSLPQWMIPAAFVTLERLPLSRTGKLDRSSLPAPATADLIADRPHEPPRTPTETVVAAVWAELLEVGRVGRDDDFFALGGDSLTAAEAVARTRERSGRPVSVRMLFAAPTVAGFSAAIDDGRAADVPLPVVERRAVPVR